MTLEDIKAAIQETPELAGELAVWATNETEKGKELLTNYSQQEKKKAVDDRTREIYDAFDNDLKELGIEKNGRKTYEAYKDTVTSLRDKVSELERLASKDPDAALTAEIESLRNAIEGKNTELDTLRRETLEANKRRLYTEAVKGLEYDERHDPDLIQLKVESLINNYVSRTEADGDTWIIKDQNGQIMLNNEHKPIDAHNALKSELANYLKSPKPQGLGTDANSEGKQSANLSVQVDRTQLANLSGVDKLKKATDLLQTAYQTNKLDVHSDQYLKDYKLLTS